MKTRNGFVSNSSSSSFIISDNNFPTVRSLATYMLNKKIEENDDYYPKDDNEIDWNKLYIERLNNIDENESVSFPSCNYDTYIKKVGDCYLVSTCNNTDWDLYDYNTRLTENANAALIELKNSFPKKSKARKTIKYILESEREEFYHIGKHYYDLDKEFIGVETYDYCTKSDTADHKYVHLWNTEKYGKICLKCKANLIKRREKINAINQVSEEK